MIDQDEAAGSRGANEAHAQREKLGLLRVRVRIRSIVVARKQ